MQEPLDLEDIESSAFRAYFEDGMLDIFFGVMFLISGVRSAFDHPIVSLLILAAVLAPILGKRYITIPRLGVVKFGAVREHRRLNLLLVIVAAVLISSLILVMSMTTDVLDGRILGDLIFGAMTIVITYSIGRFVEYPLLVVHGVIFAVIAMVSGLYGNDVSAVAWLVGGSISTLIGLANLSKFLGRYPVLPMEG